MILPLFGCIGEDRLRRVDLAGAAHLELVSDVIRLRPQDAMGEAMLRTSAHELSAQRSGERTDTEQRVLMEALKLFDPVVLLTFGGPGTSTQTVAYFLWEQVWVFNKFSFGAAASILLLFIFSILIFFGVYMLISQRRAVEGSAP